MDPSGDASPAAEKPPLLLLWLLVLALLLFASGAGLLGSVFPVGPLVPAAALTVAGGVALAAATARPPWWPMASISCRM